jgi:hypothetical protein
MACIKFNEFDMYDNAYLTLRDRYPFSKGYLIKVQDKSKEGYRPDYVIEKQIRYNKTSYFHKVVAEVKDEAVIIPAHLTQLNWYAMNHSGKHSFIIAKYLIIPSGANIETIRSQLIKDSIEIIWLRGFKRS